MSDHDAILASAARRDTEESFAATAAAPSRPSWSGLLHVGLLAIPIKAYPAVVSAPELPTMFGGEMDHVPMGRIGQEGTPLWPPA
jgi:hypothetical protein